MTLPDKLDALWRQVDALGGVERSEYNDAVSDVLDILAAAGFRDGWSEAGACLRGAESLRQAFWPADPVLREHAAIYADWLSSALGDDPKEPTR